MSGRAMKWKLSSTRVVNSTTTNSLSSIFNPRKPLYMLGNNSHKDITEKKRKDLKPKKSQSSFCLKQELSPTDSKSSGYSSAPSSGGHSSGHSIDKCKKKASQKMVKSKSESEVIGWKSLNQLDSSLDLEEEEEDPEGQGKSGDLGASGQEGDCGEGTGGRKGKKSFGSFGTKKRSKGGKKSENEGNSDSAVGQGQKDNLEELKTKWTKSVAKSKRAKYAQASSSATSMMRDFKSSASLKLSSVKNSLDYLIAQKLRLTSPKSGGLKNPMYQYGGLENEAPTPVKMYSPFSIESPSVCKSPNGQSDLFQSSFTSGSIETPKGGNKMVKKKLGKIKPGLHIVNPMAAFASPSGKLHEDIRSITDSMNELGMISQRISQSRSQILTTSSNGRNGGLGSNGQCINNDLMPFSSTATFSGNGILVPSIATSD